MTNDGPPQKPEPIGTLSHLYESPGLRRYYLQNLVHELSTPLTPLLGYLKLFQGKALGDLTPLQERCLASMHSSAMRLSRLLEDLGTLLAMESGNYRLEPTAVDLAEVVVQALGSQRESAEISAIEILEDISTQSAWVMGDEARLRSAIEHLVSNALKFNSPGGKVYIRLGTIEGEERSWIRLECYDSGIGIHPEEIDRVFLPFFQVDQSATRRFSGAGLGLALVKRTIEIHQGIIRLESPPQQQPEGHFFRGVRAVIELPLLSDSPVEPPVG